MDKSQSLTGIGCAAPRWCLHVNKESCHLLVVSVILTGRQVVGQVKKVGKSRNFHQKVGKSRNFSAKK